ncbi:MAG TPA: transcriptional regulator [Eggerthellaceae bacterium]|nr:transcriptional regulator [Eggerthellaceae bacterium]
MNRIQDCVTDYVVKNGTTKDALAEKVEIGRTSFFSKLRGTSEFSLSEAYRLSRELGCSMDDLYKMTVA